MEPQRRRERFSLAVTFNRWLLSGTPKVTRPSTPWTNMLWGAMPGTATNGAPLCERSRATTCARWQGLAIKPELPEGVACLVSFGHCYPVLSATAIQCFVLGPSCVARFKSSLFCCRFRHALAASRTKWEKRHSRRAYKFLQLARKTKNSLDARPWVKRSWMQGADLRPVLDYLSSI